MRSWAAAFVFFAVLLGAHRDASAQEPERTVVTGPNRLLLTTGAATFAFGYLSAAYVGVTSAHEVDRVLLIPFAGPWIALASYQGCDQSEDCDAAPTYRALLIGDGIVQLAGAAQVVIAFFLREVVPRSDPRIKPTSSWSSLEIAPVHMRAGLGIAATSVF